MTAILSALQGIPPKDIATGTIRFALLLMVAGLSTSCLRGEEPPLLRCGSQCLYTVLMRFETGPNSFGELDTKLGQPTTAGYSMQQLADAASDYGLHVQGVNTSLANLSERNGVFACIANLNKNHFVLLTEIAESNVRFIDPPHSMSVPTSTFQTQWDGHALLISNDPLEPESDVISRIWWRHFRHRTVLTLAVLFSTAVTFLGVRKWRGQ